MPRKKMSRREASSKKKSRRWLGFFEWVSTLAVFLSVGFAMVSGTLVLPSWIGGDVTTIIVGWVIVVSTFAEIFIEIFRK